MSIPRSMRAVVIPAYGEADVLELRDVPVPALRERDVLVRVRAAGLNRADVLQRRGRYPPPAGASTEIPGLELAGEVVARGAEASRWNVGDRVFGITAGGAHAEYAALDERHLAPIPPRLSWTEAAAIPEAFVTVHDALVVQAGFRDGDRVVIHAVGSGVGVAAVQLIRALGGKSFGTSRTPAKIDRCVALGMDAGAVVGTDPAAAVEEVMKWSAGAGAAIVLDLVGGPYLPVSVACLAPRGTVMCIGTIAGRDATIPLGLVLGRRIRIIGTVLRSRNAAEKAAAVGAFERDVIPLLQGGALRPVVEAVFPRAEVAEAHRLMESDATFGKVVLDLAP
jgi:NADPH:quinone reductase